MSNRITNTENIIGEGSVFEGTIKLKGTLRIDGLFIGKQLAMEHILVGKSGRIKSEICADSIVIEGVILGNIFSKIRAMLLPTAKIKGNISTPELIIQNGVIWDGHCTISTNSSINIDEIVNNSFKMTS